MSNNETKLSNPNLPNAIEVETVGDSATCPVCDTENTIGGDHCEHYVSVFAIPDDKKLFVFKNE